MLKISVPPVTNGSSDPAKLASAPSQPKPLQPKAAPVAISCKSLIPKQTKKMQKSSKISILSTSQASAALKAALLAQSPARSIAPKPVAMANKSAVPISLASKASKPSMKCPKPNQTVGSSIPKPAVKPLTCKTAPTAPTAPVAALPATTPTIEHSTAPSTSSKKFVPIRPMYRPLLPKPLPANLTQTAALTSALRRAACKKSSPGSMVKSQHVTPEVSRAAQNGIKRGSAKAQDTDIKPITTGARVSKILSKKSPLLSSPVNNNVQKKVMPDMPSTTSTTPVTTNASIMPVMTQKCTDKQKTRKQKQRQVPISIAPSNLISKDNNNTKSRRASTNLASLSNIKPVSGFGGLSDLTEIAELALENKEKKSDKDLLSLDSFWNDPLSSQNQKSSYFIDLPTPPSSVTSSSSPSPPFGTVSDAPSGAVDEFGTLLDSDLFQLPSFTLDSLNQMEAEEPYSDCNSSDNDIDTAVLCELDVDALTSSIDLDSENIMPEIPLEDTKVNQLEDLDLWLSPESITPSLDLENLEQIELDGPSLPTISSDYVSLCVSPASDTTSLFSETFSENSKTSSRASSVDESINMDCLKSHDMDFGLEFDFNLQSLPLMSNGNEEDADLFEF